MNSNRFSARSYESTNGGNTVLNALISGNGAMQRASSEASVTGGGVAPVVRAGNALINAASSVGNFSPGRNNASSVGSFSPGRNNNRNSNNNNRMSDNNYGNVRVRNALRNIERQNMLEAQNDANLMILNADELAALEHFAMSPGTPSHRNKIN